MQRLLNSSTPQGSAFVCSEGIKNWYGFRSQSDFFWQLLLENQFVTFLHIPFSILYVALRIRKIANSFFRQEHNDRVVVRRFGNWYKAIVCSSIYLALLYLIESIWLLLHQNQQHWLYLEICANVQTLAWLIISFVTLESLEGAPKFPRILRAWWILSFLLYAFPATFSLVLAIHRNYNIIQVLNVASLPAYVLLFLAGVQGNTRALSMPSQLEEPFLDNTNHEYFISDQVTPYSTAGILSLITFSWITSLLKKGFERPLQAQDIPLLGNTEKASTNYTLLYKSWAKLKVNHVPAMWAMIFSLLQVYWKQVAVTAIFAAANICATYTGPYLINDLVEYLGGRVRFQNEATILTLLFLGAKIIENICQRQLSFLIQLLGLHLQSALTAFVYQKAMHLSNVSRQIHTSGEIINYMTVDIARVGDFTLYMHASWCLPLQIILALIILFKSVGSAAIVTLVAFMVIVAANTPLAGIQEKFQGKIMQAKDERMRATTECLRSMKVLKLQAWEKAYLKKLESLRTTEYSWLFKYFMARSALMFVFWTTPMLVSVVTFATCMLLRIPLTAGRVLSALATIQVLQDPLSAFPEFISELAQAKVSLNRLCNYLEEQEIQEDAVTRLPKAARGGDIAVDIRSGTFSWDASESRKTLSDLNLSIPEGTLVAVCGGVGAGKSSFLSCILGEIPKLSGEVIIRGSTAYVGQTAWIQSGTVEDNILFGRPMDIRAYEEVLEVCQLQKDLELFPYGDQTEIGERGINLSGGQKQRIQLARAVYQNADIYLLDDTFSAVDVQTGIEIYKKCILGLLTSKTIVLVTHQLDLLAAADRIVVLCDGKIVQAGLFNEISQGGTEFESHIGAHAKAMEVVGALGFVSPTIGSQNSQDDDDKSHINGSEIVELANNQMEKKDASKQLVQEEEKGEGRVSMGVYWSYISAVYGGLLVLLIIGAPVCFQLLQISGNWWMANHTPASSEEKEKTSNSTLLIIYCALSLGSAMFVLLRGLMLSIFGLGTAQKFYFSMLHSLFHAPMSFFDSTPTSRILNRASTDQSTLDLELPVAISGLAGSTVSLLAAASVMSQAAWEVFLIFVPVIIACLYLQQYYIASSRELSRLVGIQKAPIIHHFGESLSGAATIRGLGQKQRFMDKNLFLIDSYSCPLFHSFAAMEWISLLLELLGIVVFSFVMILLVSLPVGTISPGWAGLAVIYGLNFNMYQSRVIWNLSTVENKIISVERMQQYSHLQSEAPWSKDDSRPPQSWPFEGKIELHSLQVRYNPQSPIVLHDLNCTFPGGKKVGIVGRTGSGKSTLLQALFRIVEPSAGSIIIDGIDIGTIGLHDLRSRLCIVPQEPTMFEGTARYNLDPLREHSDEEIWKALDKCGLGGILRAKEEKLDFSVTDNGENWSVGQRQLFALGRVMMRRKHILVLDEPTASVDAITEGVIQATLRKEFVTCTVITIAHRLSTIMDSDLVLVLNEGRILEYDRPAKLLKLNQSAFYKLVSEFSKSSNNVVHTYER